MDGQGALSIDIKPVGDGTDINRVVVGAAVTAGNHAADIMGTLPALNFIQEDDVLVTSVSGYQGCASAGDRDGVVVFPNSKIDFVINWLSQVAD